MAELLAYKRSARQVVTVDTINATVTDLGNDLLSADTTSTFPNRCENLVCVYRGDVYMLYRTVGNTINLALYDYAGGTWSDVPAGQFPPITTATGVLTPLCLQIMNDRLTVVVQLSGSAGSDGVIARRSGVNDATTWSANVTQTFTSQPLDSSGGPSIVWHNAVWFTTAEGIAYYDPDGNTLSTFDSGSDSNITGQKANFGAFSFWDYDLYYILPTDVPTGAPTLYKLDRTWTVASPTPTFTKQTVVIPATGNITVADDTGNYALFVNKLNKLCALYSGSIGTKLIRIETSGTSYSVDDLTQTVLPSSVRSEPDLGFGYYVDDRRSSNEQHTILVRFRPAIPVAVLLLSWDGSSTAEIDGTLDDGGAGLDLMVPDEERGTQRTYTGDEPSCAIDSTSAPFPGRTVISYTVRDRLSRYVDVFPEYSLDGETWSSMTQGDGGDPILNLSAPAAGTSYDFNWDAYVDLEGSYDHVDIRLVARVSGV